MRPPCFDRPGPTWDDDDRRAAKAFLFYPGDHLNGLRAIAATEFSKWRAPNGRPLFEDKDAEDSIHEYAHGRLRTIRETLRGKKQNREQPNAEIEAPGEVRLKMSRFDKKTVPLFDPAFGSFENWNRNSFKGFVRNWARREAFRSNKAISIDEPFVSESAASLADLLEDADTIRPDRALEQKENLAVVVAALERIDSAKRRILVFHYSKGMSCKEIADGLEISEGTLKKRLQRAREELLAMTHTLAAKMCVKLLTGRQRLLLRFRYLDENSAQRIAERLSLSTDQAEQELDLARIALSSKLEEEFGERFCNASLMFVLCAKVDWKIVFEDSDDENPPSL